VLEDLGTPCHYPYKQHFLESTHQHNEILPRVTLIVNKIYDAWLTLQSQQQLDLILISFDCIRIGALQADTFDGADFVGRFINSFENAGRTTPTDALETHVLPFANLNRMMSAQTRQSATSKLTIKYLLSLAPRPPDAPASPLR